MKKVFMVLLSFFCVAYAQDKQKVAVYMAGEEPSGIEGVHKVVGGELAKAMSRSDRYSAIDRTEAILDQLGREHRYQRSGAVSEEEIREIGRQFGVRYLCIAEISALRGGASYYLDVRLVDVETAEIINTASAGSDFGNGDKMIRVAWQVASELAGVARSAARQKPAKTVKPKKPIFWVGVGLDALGAGLLAYGLYEESNVKSYKDNGYKNGTEYENAKNSLRNRNIGYIAGGAFILSGVSIHIFF